jgi:hypothetical protein
VAGPVSWPDAIEIERVVPPSGNMTVGPQQFCLGTSRTGQSVSFWIDTTTVHMSIDRWRIKTVPSRLSAVDLARLRNAGARPDGVLWWTLPCPIPPRQRHRLQGVRLAGPDPLPQPRLAIQRRVSSRGGIQVARRRIQVDFSHAGKTVTIQLADTTLRVIDQHGELLATVPRNGTNEISRFKADGTRRSP